MTDARTGSINLIADARGDGTAAYVQAMHAVVDFLPDHRHMVSADALVTVVEAAQTVTVRATDLRAVVDMTIPSTAQASAMSLIADINPSIAQIGGACVIVDAERPHYAQATGLNAVVNARSQSPRALANAVVAIADARSTTPPAMTAGVSAIVSFSTEIQAQASNLRAVVSLMNDRQVQAGIAHLVADGSARPHPQQTQIGSLYAIVNGILAGEPHEYLRNRMRHGKRSKIGAISSYGES